MRFDFKTLVILLSIIFNLQTQVLAGDSIGLSVSCTIPLIPGVNAPLNDAVNIEPAETPQETKKETFSPNTEAEEQQIFIEELQEIQIAQENQQTLTKIIYSR